MSILQRIGKTVGHNSWLIRRLRPLREASLEAIYGRQGMVRYVNGVPFRVLPRYRWHFTPVYDGPVASFLRGRVHPGAVCFSLGAYLGIYPMQLAHWSGATGRVIAFEPNPETAAVLRRHISLNRMSERVRVIEQAVAERPGQSVLHAAGVDEMSRLGTPNAAVPKITKATTVSVESLDRFCGADGVRPDVLIMDVEGFEASVLQGARQLFRDYPPKTVVVEMHPEMMNRAQMEQFLNDLRLRAVPLSGQSDALAEHGHVSLEPNFK
jgi:FkbM family methyltransferase